VLDVRCGPPRKSEQPRANALPEVTKVTLYTKSDCSLCEKALRVIERVHARRAFELETVDITGDEALIARYGERIPVIEVDGVPACELQVDEEQLVRLIDSRAATAA
jgi:glutaredoxin